MNEASLSTNRPARDRRRGSSTRSSPMGEVARFLALAKVSAVVGATALAGSLLEAAPAAGQDPVQALLSGDYPPAIRAFEAAASQGDFQSLEGLVTALLETGDLGRAQRAAQAAQRDRVPGADGVLGRVLLATGRIEEARPLLEEASDGGPGAEQARLGLGVLEYTYGDRDRAYELFDGFIDFYNNGGRLDAKQLETVGRALTFLSRRDYALAHDALRALDEAQAAGPRDHGPNLALGNLFLERFDAAQATESFRAVLNRNPNHPEALLGLARARQIEGSGQVVEAVSQALAANPNLAPAHVLMAQVHLVSGDAPEALESVGQALDSNPLDPDALATRAAILHLEGRSGEFQALQREIGTNVSRPSRIYEVLAELSANRRKYQDARDFARQATEIDSLSWTGWGLLGMNQVRLGDVDRGRQNLERAFAGDPFNVWFKNTLDLVDTFDQYEVVETEHFELVLHESEAHVLGPYVESIAERAYGEMVRRYGYTPEERIRVEVYPNHSDFSVRTVGLTGMGALGVSFGPALAMDSPSARAEGEFNWASTLWHEIAHSFHLGLTNHEVPRWFSEGLAVHEQRKASAGWGHQASPGFVQALASGTLRPVSELDRSFSHPRHPGEVLHGYYQASLVFELIEEEHGFDAIVAMLRAYRNGADDAEAFELAINTSLDRFDGEFQEHLENRFASAINSLGSHVDPANMAPPRDLAAARAAVAQNPAGWAERMGLAKAFFQASDWEAAQEHFEVALRQFPQYGGPDGPHWHLAQIANETGDLGAAEEHLTDLLRLNESHGPGIRLLSDIRERRANTAGAAQVLGELAWIQPFSIEDHRRRAELLEELGDWSEAVAARRAIVGLSPTDRAGALYQLARAHYQAGDLTAARRHVLSALEVAPSYEAALELLLEIRNAGRPT